MISKPLFINVAESIVIFRPITQFGCFSASARVISSNVSFALVRNGPPLAVKIIRLMLSGDSPTRHCAIAECSESIGRISVPVFLARAVISSPATTSVSLLAMATLLPALMASIVGRSPAKPTIAATTISISLRLHISLSASAPVLIIAPNSLRNVSAASGSVITTVSGWNSAIWLRTSSTDLFALIAFTENLSGLRRITSSVLRPMLPVEPRSVTDLWDAEFKILKIKIQTR